MSLGGGHQTAYHSQLPVAGGTGAEVVTLVREIICFTLLFLKRRAFEMLFQEQISKIQSAEDLLHC